MSIRLSADAGAEGKPLAHYWNECVGAGRANEGLRTSWQEQLRLVVEECGFKYLRFHGLFHDDMFVYRKDGDKAIYNWQYIDELFDTMLDIGIRPFVELGFCPRDLATKTETTFWWKGHGSPPNDYNAWAELVSRFVKHCIDRYGIDEVRQWYFEVWNEPNLDNFFAGTRDQYHELYRVSAQAIKEIDASLRVGGPATSAFYPDERVPGQEGYGTKPGPNKPPVVDLVHRDAGVEEFIAFCRSENAPFDFISTHPYPTSFAFDQNGAVVGDVSRCVASVTHDLRQLRRLVDHSPNSAAEIHCTEWSSSPSPRDHTHDYLQAATYIVRANIEASGFADSLSYWVFTDVFEEGGAGDSIFHGGFGLINFQGIVKPAFHAYRFLNSLGSSELARTDGCIVTRKDKDRAISCLAWNYPPEVVTSVPVSNRSTEIAEKTIRTGKPRDLHLEFTGLAPGSTFVVETLDQEHGFALREWQRMGSPEPPTREQAAQLRTGAWSTLKESLSADKDGKLVLSRVLEPWSVVSIRQE